MASQQRTPAPNGIQMLYETDALAARRQTTRVTIQQTGSNAMPTSHLNHFGIVSDHTHNRVAQKSK
jgi:hypothetical protein